MNFSQKEVSDMNDWEKMTGIFRVCRKCRFRRGNQCLYRGECEALYERAEISALSEGWGWVE